MKMNLIIILCIQTPLHNTVYKGSGECVDELIKAGSDLAAKDVRCEREWMTDISISFVYIIYH